MKLIVKSDINLSADAFNKFRNNMIKDMNEKGVVVLPSWCRYEILDDNISVEVEDHSIPPEIEAKSKKQTAYAC